MSYVYIRSEASLWTVGFYDPSGDWHTDSDHSSQEKAAQRVAWLNGSGRDEDDEQAQWVAKPLV